MNKKVLVQKILQTVGVVINGNNDWDIVVKNEKFYNEVLSRGSLGLGESYVNG